MICVICGSIYEGSPKSKVCSKECRKEHYKRYRREYYREYMRTEKGQKHVKKLIEKRSQFRKIYKKEKLPKQRKQRKERLSDIQLKKLEEISLRQQYMVDIERGDMCIICGSKSSLVAHHVTYVPQETITLCSKCHGILHHRLLKGKKCKGKTVNIS